MYFSTLNTNISLIFYNDINTQLAGPSLGNYESHLKIRYSGACVTHLVKKLPSAYVMILGS